MVEGNLVKNCLADRQKIINKINTDKLIIGVCIVVLILVLITFFGYTKGKDTFMIYVLDLILVLSGFASIGVCFVTITDELSTHKKELEEFDKKNPCT